MLIDFHTHLFPPDVRDHRERYCARDPWFNKLYSSARARMVSAEDLIAEMDASGVDASVAFSFGWTDRVSMVWQYSSQKPVYGPFVSLNAVRGLV